MSKLTIIAKLTSAVEQNEVVKTELQKLVAPTRLEKGCINYDLYQDNEDPNVFLFYENWENAEDLDAHMKSAHFINCFEKIENMVSKEVHKATQL